MDFTFNIDGDEVLGGPEWKPTLHISLYEDGGVNAAATETHSSDNGVPFHIWHKRTLRYSLSLSQGTRALPDEESIRAFVEEIAPLLERVHAGHLVEWDGSNHVGSLTEDAQEADSEIERKLQDLDWTRSDVQVWDAGEWLEASWREVAEKFGLSGDTDAAAIKAAGEALVKQARSDDIIITDVEDALENIIERIREEAEEE